jgi:hypothetical protein
MEVSEMRISIIAILLLIVIISPVPAQVKFSTPEQVYKATVNHIIVSVSVGMIGEQEVDLVYLDNPSTQDNLDAVAIFKTNTMFLIQFFMWVNGEWLLVYDYSVKGTIYNG